MGDSRTIMIKISADGRAAVVEMDNISRSAGSMGENVDRAGRRAGQGMRSFRLSTSQASQEMISLVGNTVTFGALIMAIGKVSDAAKQTERATTALAVQSRYAGESMVETQKAAEKLTADGLMPVTEASQALQNLLSRGYTLQQAVELMNRLKDSAAYNRQAHLEFGQSIVGATEGLKNENSVLVDNAGVTKNVSVMWKEYALQHGKAVDSLTQAEKRQAEYNGIMRETEGQVGNAARMVNSLQGAQSRSNKEMFEAKAAAGQALVPALTEIARAFVPVARGFRDFIGLYQSGIVGIAALIDKASVVYSSGGLLGMLFSTAKRDEVKRQFQIINQAAEAQKQEIFDRLNNPGTPDIGPDSGKRRQDLKLPDDKDKKKQEAAAKNARDISMIIEAARDRDLLIGKEKDEKDLIQLDARHKRELKQLTDHKAARSKIAELAAMQEKERADLVAHQQEERAHRMAASSARIAEAEFQAKAQWLDKLDQYQVKTGTLDETTAFDNKYQRERDLLALKQESLGVEILHEKEQSKQNELIAEYWRLEDQINRSAISQGYERIEVQKKERSSRQAALESELALQMGMIQLQEAQGVIKVVEAQQQQLAVLKEQALLKQQLLETMTRNTPEEITAWNQQEAAIADVNRQIAVLEKNLRLRNGWDGLMQGLDDYADSAMNLGAQIQSATQNAFKGMEDALLNFTRTGKLSFADLANSIINDLIRIAIRASITGPLAQAIGGINLGGLFGGGGSSLSPLQMGQAGVFHDGGLIVPRFHFGGLANDEVPAILQTGERVLDREHNALLERFANKADNYGTPNLKVEIINQSSQPVKGEQGNMRFDGHGYVVGVILKDVANNGPLRGLMGGASGGGF